MPGRTNAVSGGETSSTTLKKLLDATKNAQYLFSNYTGTSIDDLIAYDDTSNVENMSHMFRDSDKLTTIIPLNTGNVIYMDNMFYGSSKLISVPFLDLSKVRSTSGMFKGCNKLKIIPQFDVSNVEYFGDMFAMCYSLKSILMTGMKVSFNISASTQFETEDLVTILNNLATVETTQTLTMGATNLAKLTDEEKAIATNKGWTLA